MFILFPIPSNSVLFDSAHGFLQGHTDGQVYTGTCCKPHDSQRLSLRRLGTIPTAAKVEGSIEQRSPFTPCSTRALLTSAWHLRTALMDITSVLRYPLIINPTVPGTGVEHFLFPYCQCPPRLRQLHHQRR